MGKSLAAVIATVLLAAPAAPVAAQDARLGLKLGLSSSWLAEESVVRAGDGDARSRRTLVAGAFAVVPLSRQIDLRAEVLYAEKGDQAGGGAAPRLVTRLKYIELPLLIRYRLPFLTPEHAHLHFFGGPAVAVDIGCTMVQDRADETEELDCASTSATLNSRKSWDLGPVLGVGVEHQLGAGRIGADLRYTMGLRRIEDVAGLRNRSVSLAIGYGISL